MSNYFDKISKVQYEGANSTNPFAFKHYNPDEVVLGKTMAEHLRLAVCYWHTFCWTGNDMFGVGSLDRSWQKTGDLLQGAKQKAEIAFEFFQKLGIPYYCFHDVDVAPEGNNFKEYQHNFNTIVDILEQKQAETGVKIIMGYGELLYQSSLYVGCFNQSESGSLCLGGSTSLYRNERNQTLRRRKLCIMGRT